MTSLSFFHSGSASGVLTTWTQHLAHPGRVLLVGLLPPWPLVGAVGGSSWEGTHCGTQAVHLLHPLPPQICIVVLEPWEEPPVWSAEGG